MNFKEIIGPDELDWKVIPLDWKKIGKDELKLGTPMSKDGVEANDASCYGILMDDVEKGKHEQARVIVSGCVDFTKAEEYSGIKVSAEAKKAIGKVWSQGGGGLTELPEGYPYKEGSKTEIVWDGNPEGKVNVEINGEVIFTKVSDATPSVDELSPMYAQTAEGHKDGKDPTELNADDIMTGNGCIYILVGGAPTIVIAHEPNASINMGQMSLVFPEAGVYFGPFGHYGVTGYFCYGSETIHTMAPEFLPAGVGGNDRDFIIDATRDADDNISSKTTFDEVVAAVKSRKVPVLYCDGPDGYLLKNTSHLVYAEGTTVNAVTFQFEHASAGFVIVVEPSGWFIG